MRQNCLRSVSLSAVLLSTLLVIRPAYCAQAVPDVNQVRKTLWTSEAIRSVRSGRDYQAVLALLITDEALKRNLYPDASKLQQAIAKAASLTHDISAPTIDPDLNATTLRVMLDHLRNAKILPTDSINELIGELTKSPQLLSEEEFILRENSVKTKVEFDSFLQGRVASVFDKADDARASAILAGQIGEQHLLSMQLQLPALIDQSHIPDGILKTTLRTYVSSGTLNPDDLAAAAKEALKQSTDQFDSAQSALRTIVNSQPPLDAVMHTVSVLPNIQAKIDVARQLISSSPDQLEQFDTLRLAATILPLPKNVADTIQTVAKIGAAVQSTVSTVSHVASAISALSSISSVGLSFFTTGGLGTLAGSLGSVFGGGGPSNQEILDSINKVDSDLQDMHRDMDARFDQVDTELKKIEGELNQGFQHIDDGLRVLNVKLDDLVPTTHAIESLLLDDRTTLSRAAINSIGDRNDVSLQDLHRFLVKLTHAVELADAGHDQMTSDKFDDLMEYFSTLARTEAAKRPLSGLQVAEDYRFDTTSKRLSADSSFYLTNFILSFPLAEQGNKSLEALLPMPIAGRDLTNSSYVNERVWVLAANSIATLLERWPQFGYEVPQMRTGYDQVKTGGKDLQTLVTALQTADSASPQTVSKPLGALVSSYQLSSKALVSQMQAGLVDEVGALARKKALSPAQTQALQAAFAAHPNLPQPMAPDPIVMGRMFAFQSIAFESPLINATGCNGLNVPHQVSAVLPAGPSFAWARLSQSLSNAVLSACIEVGGPISTHVVRKDWAGYHMQRGEQNGNAACTGTTDMTVGRYLIQVDLMIRPAGVPDDAAHRAFIASYSVLGPETDIDGAVVGNMHWSGARTDAGYDWNSLCRQWAPGQHAGAFVGFETYVNSNWGAFAGGFGPATPLFTMNGIASANLIGVSSAISTKNDADFNGIYSSFADDMLLAIDPPQTPGRSSDIATDHGAQMLATVNELDAKRALLANLSTLTFETTLQRDDVTSGLLFGSNSLLGKEGILEMVDACTVNSDHAPVDICLSNTFRRALDDRPLRVLDRLSLVTSEIAAGHISDNHAALQQTLDRLAADACLVPSAQNGSTCTQ